MSDSLFSSEVEAPDTRDVGRRWLADVLDLATSLLLGWGLLRALDVERSRGTLVLTGLGVWLLLSIGGAVGGWTLGRAVVGLRLVSATGAPGPLRGALRALTALAELILSPPLQRRPLDAKLGVWSERVAEQPQPLRVWRGGLLWLVPWGVLAVAAGVFMIRPTRGESLKFLKTLDGWRCCHGRTSASQDKCEPALTRAVDEARGGYVLAQTIVADCPAAAARR